MSGMCAGNQKLLVSLTFRLHVAENRYELEQKEDLAAESLSLAVDWDGVAPTWTICCLFTSKFMRRS